jgi:hypothetical protein
MDVDQPAIGTPHSRTRFPALLVRLAALMLIIPACDKADNIVVENTIQEPANQAPIIVKQGPQQPPGGFEQISNFGANGVDLWVLVGDPNGLEDISLVTVDIDSVRLDRFLLRPDTSSTGCTIFSYAPNDTIPTAAILPVPAKFSGVEFRAMIKAQGGLYVAEGFGGYGFGLPDILLASSNLESWPGGCGSAEGLIFPVVVLPPAVPVQRTAIVSLIEAEYLGITVTVYDKVGASATTTFPDWHIVFTTVKERSAAP